MLHFIYNPIAGKGRSARFHAALTERLKACGASYLFHETTRRDNAAEIARRLSREEPGDLDVIAMGGDGTLHEVLNGVEDPSRLRLGIIPCGSGNDFAAAAGIPAAPEGALDVVLKGRARYTDYLECGGVRGINAIGTGIDVDVLRRYNRMKLLKGSAAYLASVIFTLFTYQTKRFEVIRDNVSILHRAFIACVGNGTRFGGGITVCPEAKTDDGLMDVVIVDDIRRIGIPGAFIKLMQKKILQLPTTSFSRETHLRIRSDGPMPIQIDGEIYESLPFDVSVVSNRLRVYRP